MNGNIWNIPFNTITFASQITNGHKKGCQTICLTSNIQLQIYDSFSFPPKE